MRALMGLSCSQRGASMTIGLAALTATGLRLGLGLLALGLELLLAVLSLDFAIATGALSRGLALAALTVLTGVSVISKRFDLVVLTGASF